MQVKHIHDFIEPTLKSLGLTLWACDLQPSSLRVYIERADFSGVTLEDCANASREIGAILDVEDCIKTRYQLEISSPGLDRVLLTLSHFSRYVDSDVKIKWRVPKMEHRQCVARIEKVENDKIFLIIEKEKIIVTLNDIQSAKLMM